ncbi:MAG: hypothetical protein FWG12_01955 [Holophagaceae bacterium]|nr:hypothetical protein [Holophagaceae bacterium]
MANPSKQDWATIGEWAISFAKEWENARSEKSQGHDFIRAFLRVFGHAKNVGEFEKPITTPDGRTNYIDFYWKDKIAIEMKSRGKRLDRAFEQLTEYMANLPDGETPPDLWMVSDFEHIYIYDCSTKQETYFQTKKLRKYIKHFAALIGQEPEPVHSDKGAVDLKATAKMNKLFEALQEHGYKGHELEVYLARLLFCLFADDTGIFTQDAFYNYVLESRENGSDLSGRLGQLFQDLNKPVDSRIKNPFLTDKIQQSDFRYVNGDLFKEKLDLASFDKKMRETLLECLSFDWSKINPAIFGSMFQGVMDSEHRREIGAHYTTEENIKKLIDPLFMDDLRDEFKKIKKKANLKALSEFHNKLASLKFLDPACGCGNFLIIAYRELRKLELEVVREEFRLTKGNAHQLLNIETHFMVNVDQFYGIEILSWPCQIAKTGMWLMDHLCNMEASEEFGKHFARIPLEKGAEIRCANAHRIDWETIVPKVELSYILGNPPFIGYSNQSQEQKQDIHLTCLDKNGKPIKNAGKIDYVAAWYYRASKYIQGTKIRAAFVSTNSITQGEQVANVWKPLFDMFGIHIDFAYRAFKWDSEAKGKAAVHCVIIGFSTVEGIEKAIYDGDVKTTANNISPYIVDAPDVFIESRKKPICDVPLMMTGNRPADGGHLIIENEDLSGFIEADPRSKKHIRRFMGSVEFINNVKRWCLWLVGIPPEELRRMPEVMKRIAACKKDRENAPDEGRRKLAATPMLFREQFTSETEFIVIPAVSSERRLYVPIGFLPPSIIVSNLVTFIPNATLFHFGILTSSVHMAWMRAVCGRLEMSYRYSKDIVYNNFPWPSATDKQKAEIEKLAQGILDARAGFPKSSLADLYDPLTMPPELQKAHQSLDRAVMKLYGYVKDTTEPAIVAALIGSYKELTNQVGKVFVS